MFNNFFFRKSCRLWDDVEKYIRAGQATDGNTIRPMLIACRISNATEAHSDYVTRIALPRQEWWRERASMSCYTTCSVQTVLLHPSPAPHFKIFQVFLIHFQSDQFTAPQQPVLQTLHFTGFLLQFKSNLLVKTVFLFLDAAFCNVNPQLNFVRTSCIICYHATQTVEIFRILQFLASILIRNFFS